MSNTSKPIFEYKGPIYFSPCGRGTTLEGPPHCGNLGLEEAVNDGSYMIDVKIYPMTYKFVENIEQMTKRHEKEIDELQKNCKHEKISDWMPFAWAVGHFSGEVRVCINCSKIIEQRGNAPEMIIEENKE